MNQGEMGNPSGIPLQILVLIEGKGRGVLGVMRAAGP